MEILVSPFLVSLLIGFLLGYVAALWRHRADHFQNRGEAELSHCLKRNFNTSDYHLLNHITLRHRGITTQIDHILVSRFGVFVIETKALNGWIFANANHDTWTQVFFRAKFKFQNPIRQNFAHVQAVRELLDFLPANVVESVVVFVGGAEFKTAMPEGVFTLPKLIAHLQSCSTKVLSLNRVQFCVGRLETARLAISHQTDIDHVQALHHKYGQS
ncbi:MAG: nuclease-related domain-containing protein [Alphaproteobacteria bacterium]|nr:nuclease-related domain-containing protein [Alphaproteobacteria bacterium]